MKPVDSDADEWSLNFSTSSWEEPALTSACRVSCNCSRAYWEPSAKVSSPEVCDWEICVEDGAVSEPVGNAVYGFVNCCSVADMVSVDPEYRGRHRQKPAVKLPRAVCPVAFYFLLFLSFSFFSRPPAALSTQQGHRREMEQIPPSREGRRRTSPRQAKVKDGGSGQVRRRTRYRPSTQ